MGPWKCFLFCSFTKLCMRSQKWDRQAVPFLGPCLSSFFEIYGIKVTEAQRFGFTEALWLMATGRATREALLSEAGFEKFSGPRIGSVGASCFVDDFVSCASGVHIGCCLNPVEGSFLLFRFVWWAWLFAAKRGASAFAALGHCLKCFLLLRSCGFSRKWSASIWMIVLNTLMPLVGPLAPLDSYRSFQPRKNMNYDLFS